MKKIYQLLLICIFGLCLVSCEEQQDQTIIYEKIPEVDDTVTPSYKMNSVLKDIKTSLSNGSLDCLPLDSSQLDLIDELPVDLFNKIIDMVCSFDYQIVEQNIDGNNAIVKVSFASYDFVSTIKKTIVSITKDSILSSVMNSDMSIEDLIIQDVTKALDKLEQSGKEKYITNDFVLTLEDDEWVFDIGSNSLQLLDGITGGMMSSLSELEELLDKFS